uniref:Late blight resistance protein n=1 Tax=Solanum tuberosum TaxID=4113 RepID=M1DAY7_SOLTU
MGSTGRSSIHASWERFVGQRPSFRLQHPITQTYRTPHESTHGPWVMLAHYPNSAKARTPRKKKKKKKKKVKLGFEVEAFSTQFHEDSSSSWINGMLDANPGYLRLHHNKMQANWHQYIECTSMRAGKLNNNLSLKGVQRNSYLDSVQLMNN